MFAKMKCLVYATKEDNMTPSWRTAAEAPPWVELPRDITAAILQKLGSIEKMTTAQWVCRAWMSVCRDPGLWQSIDMVKRIKCWLPYNLVDMCFAAVDRCPPGQLIDIKIDYFCTDELLLYVSQRSSQLRRLQLEYCEGVTSNGLIQAVKRLPLLEELHLYSSYSDSSFVDEKAIETIGQSCPLLKSFTFYNYPRSPCLYPRTYRVPNNEGRAIASNMPELRHLRLYANSLTNEDLQAILDGCPHLESLDLRQCFNVNLGLKSCKTWAECITDLKHPNSSNPRDEFVLNLDEIKCFLI